MKLKKWWVIALIMILPLLFIMGNLKKKTIETAENNLKTINKYKNIKRVALTFDDGPSSECTPRLLDILKKENVKATFFLVGKNIKENEDIVIRMKNEGHLIGNHTFNHSQLTKLGFDEAVEEINTTNAWITNISGYTPEYIRPPFGSFTDELLSETSMSVVMWNVDPLDWKYKNKDIVTDKILKNVKNGDIILMHDIFESRLTVNLAPADTKKAGTAYDLPILLSILAAAGEIDAPPDNALFFGELSLTGELRPVCGALSMALAARDAGFKTVFVPAMNAAEASYASGVTVFPIRTLNELLGHLNGRKPLTPCAPPPRPEPQDDALDFAHVLGQHAVKRALEIAAAGGHNVLLSGPPGSGKSMAAKRFSTILPPLSDSERLEVIRVWSAIGRGQEAVERAERPFRAPHHNSSANAMAGGSGAAGRLPVPGEITLAHRGVLFLDEFPEFRRDVLETLRQPLEDGKVTISRVAGQVTYPARFQLIAAMNPCKCGWYGTERCTCTKAAVQQYLHRLSGPLLDRIDLQVAVQPVEYAALAARGQASEEHSADIRARVLAARERQYARQGADVCNAAIPPPQLAEHCPLSADASRMFAAAFQRLGLTARAHDRVLRVARTIADLADSSVIEAEHLAEALQYRSLDRAAGS